MNYTLMFIDNGFFKLVKKEIEKNIKKKKKLLQTFRNICKKEKLHLKHLFFYAAPPYQNEIPTEKEKTLMKNYKYLLKILKYKKWVTVREGRCQRLKIDGKFQFKQKAVDVLLTLDLASIPNDEPNIKKIILIASDSDFIPVIKKINTLGIKTILYTYFSKKNRKSIFSSSNELIKSVHKYKLITKQDFEKSNLT